MKRDINVNKANNDGTSQCRIYQFSRETTRVLTLSELVLFL